MQIWARHKIKQPMLPQALQRIPPPPGDCLSHVRIGDTTVILNDDAPDDKDLEIVHDSEFIGDSYEEDDSHFIDSGVFDFHVPPTVNVADIQEHYTYESIVHNPMDYRAFQN
jgi:hypothetical protein